ncbi:MAG: hypothetical protein ABI565_02270 [Vicinamibacteria bacterium]
MSAIKTVAGFAIMGALLASGAKAQRVYELEADATVAPLIEQGVRMSAANFNPKVALVMPELKGFSISGVEITHSRIGALLESTIGDGGRSYDVYVRFRESGDDRCMTLELKRDARGDAWKVTHPGGDDRCAPVW